MAVAGLSAWVLYQAAFIERSATAGGRRPRGSREVGV